MGRSKILRQGPADGGKVIELIIRKRLAGTENKQAD
jgi:hypothetical protein